MKYVKLTVIDEEDSWYKPGTEVWHYDEPRRITLDEFEKSWKPYGFALVRGIRNTDGEIDGESSALEEFSIEIVDTDNHETISQLMG